MVALALPCLLLYACAPAATGGGESPGTGGKSASSGGSSGSGGSSSGSGGTPSGTGGSSGGNSGGTSGSTGGSSGSGNGGTSGGEGGSSGSTGGSSGSASGGTSGGSTGGTSGSGPDAGGGSDTPSNPGGAMGCTGFTGKYCSDFENQTAGGAPNGNGDFSVSGAVTVDGAKAFSGTKSLHYKPGGKSQIVFTKQFPFNEQHGRLMMFVAKTPPNASHWDIVQSNSSANTIWSWGGMYGKFELVVDPPDDGKDSNTPFPDGKWVCVQWRFSPGTGAGSIYSVKLDGTDVDKSPVNNHWKAGAWKDLRVGYEVFGSAPIEFWIDDLAFGEQEIPCPNK
jgi:hypothetical protein